MTYKIKTVLLVDDDQVTNIMHRRIIEKTQLVDQVLVATDGRAALELLESLIEQNKPLPELIFLDINMPRMDGFEFLAEYAARGLGSVGKKIIVMLSTSLLKSDHDKAKANPHVHSFTNKLIKQDVFTQVVEDFMAAS